MPTHITPTEVLRPSQLPLFLLLLDGRPVVCLPLLLLFWRRSSERVGLLRFGRLDGFRGGFVVVAQGGLALGFVGLLIGQGVGDGRGFLGGSGDGGRGDGGDESAGIGLGLQGREGSRRISEDSGVKVGD